MPILVLHIKLRLYDISVKKDYDREGNAPLGAAMPSEDMSVSRSFDERFFSVLCVVVIRIDLKTNFGFPSVYSLSPASTPHFDI